MANEYLEKLDEYAKMFGDGFPTIPLAWGRTEEEIIALIDDCIKAGKDAYELGLVSDDDDILY